MNKTFYITTPIYYPSGKFHIGTAYTTILADSLKRYKKLRGYDCYMLTGTDEHGQKIENIAKKNNESPKEYVDKMAKAAKELWKKLEIDYDDYIQTTEERHEKIVQKIFERFLKQGDIYKGEYEGWYCEPCESYFTETQLVDGKCPDCGREVKKMKEESYFFNMKKYTNRLLEYYWGIKVLSDPKHVIYVWLDALTNYITALGYMSDDDTLFKKYWPANVHVVAKDIARFHLIYWPIFLMALDLPLPETIYVHNFIMMKDGKMSKSKGNVIYPEILVNRYGLDATKYALLREMPYSQDGVFSPESFVERYNFDLCNDLGNLVNRSISMVNKYLDGNIDKYVGQLNETDIDLENVSLKQINEYEKYMDNFEIANVLKSIWVIVSRTNKYIDETSPWILAKDDSKKDNLKSVMYHLIESIRRISILIYPFMKDTSENIFKQIGITDENLKSWESLKKYDNINNIKVIDKGQPIFMRLDSAEEIEYIKNSMKNN